MKLPLLLVSSLAAAVTTQAQQVQFALKAAAGYSLPRGKHIPISTQVVPVSGGAGVVLQLPDPNTYTLQAKPSFTAGLVARTLAAGRWSYGAELLLQYQPFIIEQRFSPAKAGHAEYVSAGGSGGFVRDQNGNILLDANGQPRRTGTISRADLPTRYRYSMAMVELPLYARYKAAERWHVQAGVAPSLLLNRQVRIETSYPEVQANGQARVATTSSKQNDPALRLTNWRMVVEVEYQLTPRVACTLSLRPSLSGVFATDNQQKRMVPYQVKQQAVSVAAVYFLQ